MSARTAAKPLADMAVRAPLMRLVVLLVCLAVVPDSQAQDPWIRHFRAGGLLGANFSADFSMDGTFSLAGSQPGNPADPKADHNYDDGYVRVDATGNAKDLTSYWGYQNASQYDAGAGTLTFHSSQSFTASAQSTEEGELQFGLDLAYGGSIKRIGRTWISWEAGFSFLPVSITDESPLGATFPRIADVYSGLSIVPPAAGYQGDSSGQGPSISSSGTRSSDTEILSGTVSGSRKLDVNLYNFRLGPHFHWDLNRNWSVEAMGGFAAAWVDGSYQFGEIYTLSDGGSGSNSSEFSHSQFVYGGYAGVLTQVHVEKNAYLYGSAQFMSLGDAEFSEAGRSASLNLGQGLYFSLGFTWLF